MIKLFKLSVSFLIVLMVFSSLSCKEKKVGFYIRDFFVEVEKSSVKKNGAPILIRRGDSPFDDVRATFSGKGIIEIKDIKIPVKFNKVKIKKSTRNDLLIAIAGKITAKKPSPREKKFIRYSLDGFTVQTSIQSIEITPKYAVASVGVMQNISAFYTESLNKISLNSRSCNIQPNGAIESEHFKGNAHFDLKDSVYRLTLNPADYQFVRLGKFYSGSRVFPKIATPTAPLPRRIRLTGIASRDGIELFSFTSTINPHQKYADFSLNLLVPTDPDIPLIRYPEPGYVLSLLSGNVEYEYDASGLTLCEGSLKGNLALPETIFDSDNNRIHLQNITLKTDQHGKLFNFVALPDIIKAGFSDPNDYASNIFLIQPKEKHSYVYFPIWHLENPHSSYVFPDSKIPTCGELQGFLDPQNAGNPEDIRLNATSRPGLTVLRGILYFKAPQVTFSSDATTDPFNLKSTFWGALTCTPYGITGELSSLNASFIPSEERIENCSRIIRSPIYSMEEIKSSGNTLDTEIQERFRMEGFRILNMHVDRLLFCKNEMVENPAFRYTVHFPFPSFIDLEFEDTSLDKFGEFSSAIGPIAPISYMPMEPSIAVNAIRLTESTEMVTLPKNKYILNSQILFAWRLPVMFSHHGVEIQYSNNPATNVARVNMQPLDPDNLEIMSSELRISPLFSKNSYCKFGIRFQGTLDPDGIFTLLDWDREPVFSRIYPAPGSEKAIGFSTQYIEVKLSDWNSDPEERDFDFKWIGDIHFSFFGEQSAVFNIKNFVPQKLAPVSLSGRGDSPECLDKNLEVIIRELDYSPDRMMPFISRNMSVFEIDGNVRRQIEKTVIYQCLSYHKHNIYLDLEPVGDKSITQEDISITPNVILKDPIPNTSIIDLVCYDSWALNDRTSYITANLDDEDSTDNLPPDSCCDSYHIGTLQVISPNGTIVMSATNTKYYTRSNPLILNDSEMSLLSSQGDSIRDMVLNIPGAQLYLNDEGIFGSYGATFTPVAMELPYEGEFRFFINYNDGHFYVQSGGSFTYGMKYRGQIFIFHAPLKILRAELPLPYNTNLLESVARRALFSSAGDLEEDLGWDNRLPEEVLTGFLTAGNAHWSLFDIPGDIGLSVESGPVIFVYDAATGGLAGTSLNSIVTLNALILQTRNSDNFSGVITDGGPMLDGNLNINLCANGFLHYVSATVEIAIQFSIEQGLTLNGIDVTELDYGLGGCPPN